MAKLPGTYAKPSITVLTPNGGEIWTARSKHDIEWSTVNVSGHFKIEVLKAGVPVKTIRRHVKASKTSCTWSIPASWSPGSDYRIRITSIADMSISDTSDADFTINPKPSKK